MGLGGLVDVKTWAEYCRTPEEIILKRTESGPAPHYYEDTHGPLYKKTELKQWVEDNLVRAWADGKDHTGDYQRIM